jgi:HEPN domain-containing protein
MTPEQLLLDETGAWVIRARRDLRAAGLLIEGGAYPESLFHSQQAADKAVKAFLAFHQRPFRKTHDLDELTPECLAIDGSLGSVLRDAESLSKYAWRFRYPGAPYESGESEAADALRRAEAAVRAIEQRLPPMP